MTSAEQPGDISLNLSALTESSMGSALAELSSEARSGAQENEQPETEGVQAAEGSPPLPPPSENSMRDYYQLQQNLLRLTFAFSIVIFCSVWGLYSLNTALNYIVGACTGLVYFRMLAKSVGRIGREGSKPSSGRLAIFIGVMVVSTQWQQLSVLPVFLGFLTYKAALVTFVIWTAVMPSQETAS
ncbi:MAG: ATP synthase subunit I [Cyanobacteria bacterium J06614_10]